MTPTRPRPGTILVCAIHRTTAWWTHVAAHLGYERAVVMSDVRGDGDINIVDDFYRACRPLYRASAERSELFDAEEVTDIIARCRVLRSLAPRRARAMALAMAEACARVLDETRPVAAISFPIDRYPTDILARLARKRGIPYYEFTVSPFDQLGMMLFRGQLIQGEADPDPREVERRRAEIADPLFTPSYVQRNVTYSRAKFLKVYGYFRLRALAFRAISWLKRDPLNFHYLDAQFSMSFRPRLSDIAIDRLIDRDWRERVEAIPRDKRVFMALQLFPEASIDYWIRNPRLIDYEPLLLRAARAFSDAGFSILVKDHPLQFGFRQIAFIERLREIPGVVIVPYEVSGNEVIDMVGTNFTCTGTLGLQSALLGLRSVVVPNYYSNDAEFICYRDPEEVDGLPGRVEVTPPPEDLKARQSRIVAHLLKGSFEGDYYSFRGFDSRAPKPTAASLGRALGKRIHALGPEGQDWHRSHGV